MAAKYEVTAIIPTSGRESVARSVSSALDQVGIGITVALIGVADDLQFADRALTSAAVGRGERINYIEIAPGHPADYSRSEGVAKVKTDCTAFLDDDDWWHPDKSRARCESLKDGASLSSCRSFVVSESSAVPATVPSDLYNGRECNVGDYLFRKRRLAADRNLLHTSTLLGRTDTVRECSWKPRLRRHQVWDFTIRYASQFGSESI